MLNMCKVIKIYKYYGIKGVLKKIKNKIYLIEYGYEINKENFKFLDNENYKICKLTCSLLKKMYKEYPNELEERKFYILFNRINNDKDSDVFAIIDDKENILGYYNLRYVDTIETGINYKIEINKNSVYFFDDYTFEKFRGKGVHKYSIYSRVNIVLKKGYTRVIVNIFDKNIYSKMAYEKVGFTKYIKYTCFRLSKLEKVIKTNINNKSKIII